MPDLELETIAKEKGFNFVCGVDEAGRGPPDYSAVTTGASPGVSAHDERISSRLRNSG